MDTPRKRRGRPCRVIGARSTFRLELRVTQREYRYTVRLADENDVSVADLLRCGLVMVARGSASDDPPIILGGRLMNVAPLRAPRPRGR